MTTETAKDTRPTAVIVTGPERSGTRLITRLLIGMGFDGDDTADGKPENEGWPQKWDAVDPTDGQDVVHRISLPYHPNREWPALASIAARWARIGYRVLVLVASRDPRAVVASQLANKYVCDALTGWTEIQQACDLINETTRLPVVADAATVSYRALVSAPAKAIRAIARFVGRKPPKDHEPIVDGDAKYNLPPEGKEHVAPIETE